MQPLSLVTRDGIHPTATLRRDAPKSYRSFSKVADSFVAKSSAPDYSVPDDKVPVFDQGQLGACVLNATCAAAEILLSIEGLPYVPLSRLWLYWLCSKSQGTLGEDTGTEVALAVDRADKLGFCSEALWAYTDDAAKFFVPPADALVAVLEGADNQLTATVKIDAMGSAKADQIEAAIRADHTPIFGTPVDGKIQSYQPGQVLTRPSDAAIIGGHSMLFTGVRRVNGARQFKIRNSWSADYGEDGRLWIDESFAEWTELNDIHVITRMPGLVL